MRVSERIACSIIFEKKCKPTSLFSQLLLASDSHNYGTRQSVRGKFTLPKPKTDALKKTVMYRAITYWNRFPSHLVLMSSRVGFKKILGRAVMLKYVVVDCD